MISIKNLHPDIDELELRDVISEFGTIISICMSILQSATSQSALAIIEMIDESEELMLLECLNGDLIKGRPVVIERVA